MHSQLLDFAQMPLSHIGKACFEALVNCYKRFSIQDHIIVVTIDNAIINNSMLKRFKKFTFKSAKKGCRFKPPLIIFKAKDLYIRCIAYLINLLA